VWDICKRNCVCLRTPISQDSASPDENCPYARLEGQGGEPHLTKDICRYKQCRVCILMNQLDVSGALELGECKNERFRIMIFVSEHLGSQLFAEDISQEARKELAVSLCTILCCSETRLRSIANVGVLVEMCPNMIQLRLVRGWGEVWNNLSKFGVAVGYQKTERNKLATLLYLRHSCLPNADSNWHHYLQPIDRASADTMMSTVFADCFNVQPEPENVVE